MQYANTSDGFMIRCEIGDEVIATLTKFAIDNKIYSGSVIGIGALLNPELGYYDIHTKTYTRKKFDGDYELVSLTGNLARMGDNLILHCHAAFSDAEFKVIGGHLFAAGVAVTGEFYLRPGGVTIERAPDSLTGLNLMSLK